MNLEMDDIPADYDPQPVPHGTPDSATCGSCGLSFPDLYPSARCPFEAFHEMDDEDEDEPISTWFTITREYNGAPDGPKFIVRRHAVHYEGGHDTQEDAWAWVAEQNGRVAK